MINIGILNKMAALKVFRYLIIGSFNTIFCYMIFAVFVLNNFKSVLAMTFASLITIPFSFYLMGRYVFDSDISVKKSVYFVLMQISGYIINVNLLMLTTWIGVPVYFGGIISMCITAALTFLISKFYVFK